MAHKVEMEIYTERGDLQGQPYTQLLLKHWEFRNVYGERNLKGGSSSYHAQYVLQTFATTTCHMACPWLHIVERGPDGGRS